MCVPADRVDVGGANGIVVQSLRHSHIYPHTLAAVRGVMGAGLRLWLQWHSQCKEPAAHWHRAGSLCTVWVAPTPPHPLR